MAAPTVMANATSVRICCSLFVLPNGHTAVGRRFADLVVMLPAVYRTHHSQKHD